MSQSTLSTRDITLPKPGVWKIDQSHSLVGFVGRHMVVSKVRGRFDRFEGELRVAEVPEQSTVEVRVDMTSVESGFAQRDDHLRSADLFDVERYPEMRFRATSITGSGDRWRMDGDLTIRDVTKPVTLDVDYHGVQPSPWGEQRAGFSARGEIDREEWGLGWNQVLETGGLLVGKKIAIEIEVELVLDES